ncbi:MAG: hypothetical protein ACOX50_00705 [Patescibacteria group bacterium]|jgi:hypothetical protein
MTTEAALSIEMGRNIGDIIISQDGKAHKRVVRVPDYLGSLNDCPDASDYERLVGGSINFLQNPRWGVQEMIPPCTLRLEEAKANFSGVECWIDTVWIKGIPLSQMMSVPNSVAEQLAFFLKKCKDMACEGKTHGEIVIPDLLGGVSDPQTTFQNFVVEEETGKLYFVDVYPLAEFPKGFSLLKYQYRPRLNKAAQKIGHPHVIQAARELAAAI